MTAVNAIASWRCPAVTTRAIGRQCWSAARWILVVNPPRLRPSASRSLTGSGEACELLSFHGAPLCRTGPSRNPPARRVRALRPGCPSGAGAGRRRRDGAELTGVLRLPGWPKGMRVIVRAERPHPGAQLKFTDSNGNRLTAFATNTTGGQLADLELRHRRRARCEDRIRNAKDTGLKNLPLNDF